MNQELTAVIRELEQQRNDLLSGISVAAAFERMATRAVEAVFAASKAEARAAAAEARAEAAKAEAPPEPPAGD